MSKSGFDVSAISLDADGRVILNDSELDAVAAAPNLISAGADGVNHNTGCTNRANCTNTSNAHCTNSAGQCEGASNSTQCTPGGGPHEQ